MLLSADVLRQMLLSADVLRQMLLSSKYSGRCYCPVSTQADAIVSRCTQADAIVQFDKSGMSLGLYYPEFASKEIDFIAHFHFLSEVSKELPPTAHAEHRQTSMHLDMNYKNIILQ